MLTTKVLIIGAGPTGLMAACQLLRFNIDFIIIDEKSTPTAESRAIGITARSLEIYQQMGVSNEVISKGEPINGFSLFIDGQEAASFTTGKFGKGLSDFPFLFSFEQSKNEELLYSYLIKKNKEVRWKNKFICLKQEDNSVITNVLDSTNDEEYEIKADYLLACDGAKSPVRHTLNVDFPGGTYENKFFLVDVVMDYAMKYQKILVAPSRENFCAIFPLYEAGTYRIIGTLPKKFYKEENISYQDIELIIKRTLRMEIHFKSVNWFSLYKLHHRCAVRFRAGRCFLVGDAAHIHSPAGAQGMNTGLQDAYNLAWKLAFVISGYANEQLLETYNTERIPFARWLMKFTDRIFAFATSDSLFFDWARKYFLKNLIGIAFKSKSLKKRIFKTVSQIWYSYSDSVISLNSTTQNLTFKAGERLPYILINQESLYKKLTEPSFYLLFIGNDPGFEMVEVLKNKFKNILTFFSFPITNEWKNKGVENNLVILVRPDMYIGLISDEVTLFEVEKYFQKHLYFCNQTILR